MSKKLPRPSDLPEEITDDDWKDFREHRRQLRRPMTARAEKIIARKLARMKAEGLKPLDLLETAIERGWQTVYEPSDWQEAETPAWTPPGMGGR